MKVAALFLLVLLVSSCSAEESSDYFVGDECEQAKRMDLSKSFAKEYQLRFGEHPNYKKMEIVKSVQRFNIWFFCGDAEDQSKAYKGFKILSKHDYFNSHYMVGMAHYLGRGAPKDIPLARQYFEICSDRDERNCHLMLGIIEFKGNVGKVNYEEARRFFQMAHEGGLPLAQYWLGRLHFFGLVKNADRELGRKMLSNARAYFKVKDDSQLEDALHHVLTE